MGGVISLENLVLVVNEARESGLKIVLANGAFDMLHVGHLRYLQGAAEHGDLVIAAVNSDSSVRLAKGATRPIVPDFERAELVAALGVVGWVVVFSEPTVVHLIEKIRPDVHAKGTDYRVDTVVERSSVEAFGGRVEIVGDPKDHSTSELVHRLKDLDCE